MIDVVDKSLVTITMAAYRSLRTCVLSFAILTAVYGCTSKDKAEVTRSIPWAMTGAWLVSDLHTHSRFSDGALTADNLVKRALLSGCQVMALTDHSDLTSEIATAGPEYLATLDRLRERYPELILIGGIEWNIPPYKGREHVNLLVDPSIESAILPTFREHFDSVGRPPGEDAAGPVEALRWLSAKIPASARAVLFYNHPSRSAVDAETSRTDLIRWQVASQRFIGFEGAPGHQRTPTIGSYQQRFQTIDRWDPVVANVGGVWDSLLDQGEDVWAALANSDYHNDQLDYPPCSFSRVHIQVPEHNQRGVLEALEAGTFWAEHGPILDDLLFVVQAHGVDLPSVPGEAISLNSVQMISLHLAIKRSVKARHERLSAELVSNCRSGRPELVTSRILAAGESRTHWELQQLQPGLDGESCYVRMRIRKPVENGPDLLAYTNHVRIFID